MGSCIHSKRSSDRRWGQVVCRDVSGSVRWEIAGKTVQEHWAPCAF